MSAAVEIDGRAVEVNAVSREIKEAIAACDRQDYREAVRYLCREITRLSAEITEMQEELYGT